MTNPQVHMFAVKCTMYCPGGNHCCLGYMSAYEGQTIKHNSHELHICRDPDCTCHTEERYRGVRNGTQPN